MGHCQRRDCWICFGDRATLGDAIPEPFFVHSDLTTGIQVADLVAYVISWGYRFGAMSRPARKKLGPYAAQVARLRHRTTRPIRGEEDSRKIWSFALINDLRTRRERAEEK
ncbi:MAG: DUF3800 domain-containing protein [Alphaproteobacteria bacterium]